MKKLLLVIGLISVSSYAAGPIGKEVIKEIKGTVQSVVDKLPNIKDIDKSIQSAVGKLPNLKEIDTSVQNAMGSMPKELKDLKTKVDKIKIEDINKNITDTIGGVKKDLTTLKSKIDAIDIGTLENKVKKDFVQVRSQVANVANTIDELIEHIKAQLKAQEARIVADISAKTTAISADLSSKIHTVNTELAAVFNDKIVVLGQQLIDDISNMIATPVKERKPNFLKRLKDKIKAKINAAKEKTQLKK